MGGDEFLIVCEDGGPEAISERLAAVDLALHRRRVPGLTDLMIAWGTAEFETAAGVADVVARADQAMYACKADRKAGLVGV